MSDLEKLLHDDLREASRDLGIQVSADAIAAGLARAERRATVRRRLVIGLVVALVAAIGWAVTRLPLIRDAVPNPLQSPSAAATAVAPAGTATPGTATPDATSPTSSVPTSSASTSSPGAGASVSAPALVYFVKDTSLGLRLVRETRAVTAATPARGALEAMFAGPLDPDYTSPWPTGTRVLGIAVHGDVVTVDLSAEARAANVGAGAEQAMVMQLIWTVTEAFGPDVAVQLLIEGRAAGWGHFVWAEPTGRGDASEFRSTVGIDAPTEGATLSSPVRVTGEASVFEATLLYTVTDEHGVLVADDHIMTQEGQRLAPYTLTLDLPPGTYTVTVSEEDSSDGEGRAPLTDDRTFTVR